MDPIAVRVLRGGVVESVHRASVAVADPRGRVVASFGRPGTVSFLRSAAKPLQALALIESGAADRFGFTGPEIAIAAGSHSGEPGHTELVAGMLHKIGVGPDALQCGRHAPFHKPSADAVGTGFTTLHHNCSGKHAGMLAVCVHRRWDTKTYLAPDHPLQQQNLRAVAQETGMRADRIALAVDGCGVPTFAVPVRGAARAFARVADPVSLKGRRAEAMTRIRDAMLENPFYIAGTDRLDTDLMQAQRGRLIVKAGAEAYYGAALADARLGVAVKIEDGNPRAMGPVLVRVLEELGALDADSKERVRKHWDEPVKNVVGRVVGGYECVLRLDRKEKALVLPTAASS